MPDFSLKTLLKDLEFKEGSKLQHDLYNSFLCLTALKYMDYRKQAAERKEDLQGRTMKAESAIRELQRLNWINTEATDLFSSFVDDKYPDWWTAFNSINTFSTLAQKARNILVENGFNIAAVMGLREMKNHDDPELFVMLKISEFTHRKQKESSKLPTKALNKAKPTCTTELIVQILKNNNQHYRKLWNSYKSSFTNVINSRKQELFKGMTSVPSYDNISKEAEVIHFKYFRDYLNNRKKTIGCNFEKYDGEVDKTADQTPSAIDEKSSSERITSSGRVSRRPEKYKDFVQLTDEDERIIDEDERIQKYPNLQYFRPGAIIMMDLHGTKNKAKSWPYQVLRWLMEEPNTCEIRAVHTVPEKNADGAPQKDKFFTDRSLWSKTKRLKFSSEDVLKVGWNDNTNSWSVPDGNPLKDLKDNVFEGGGKVDPDLMFEARNRWIQNVHSTYATFDTEVQGFNAAGEMKSIMVRMLRAFSFNPLSFTQQPFTFILQGPPGTGKTSMARQLGELFKASGYLLYGNVVLRGRDAFIGQYLGQTAPRTVNEIYSNLEKTLVIDEAYSLASYENGKLDSYSAEFFNAFTNELLQVKGKICIIAAGYEKEMQRDFLGGNEGLPRRFQNKITLKSFSTEELVNIFKSSLRRQTVDPLIFTVDAYKYLTCFIQNSNSRDGNFELLLDDDDGEEEKPVGLQRLFAAQAGAVVMLADVAGIYINAMSEEAKCIDQMDCFNVCDMKSILVEYIEKGFTAEAKLLKHRYEELDDFIQSFGNCFTQKHSGRHSAPCPMCGPQGCKKT